MTIWDEYCIVCHGPLYNQLRKGNIVTNISCFKDVDSEIFQLQSGDDYLVTETQEQYDWLNKLYGISTTDKVIRFNSWHYTGNGAFKIKQDLYFIINGSEYKPIKENTKINVGIVCHTECYKFLKANGYDLKFSKLDKNSSNNCMFNKQQYGYITRYCKKFFNFYESCMSKGWMLESPLINKKNADRIKKIWKDKIESSEKKTRKSKKN